MPKLNDDLSGRQRRERAHAVLILSTVLILGVCVLLFRVSEAGSWHNFIHHHRRSETRPLWKLRRAAHAYYERGRLEGGDGPFFPPTTPLTPSYSACEVGGTFDGDVSHWQHPTWKALGFEIDHEHRLQFRFVSDGKSFTARAIGDHDCDGVLSTFEFTTRIEADGRLNSGAGMYVNKPEE